MQFHAIITVLILNMCVYVCLGCSPFSRSLHSYVDVNINSEGLPKFDLCLAGTAIEQLGFLSVPQLLWHGGICLLWSSPRTRGTHTYCWAFGSGAETTCFYELGSFKVIKKTCWKLMTYDIYMIWNCLLIKKWFYSIDLEKECKHN